MKSRTRNKQLKKRVADLEQITHKQQLIIDFIWEFSRSVANREGLSLLSYQQLHSPSTDSNEKVRMLLEQIRELG